MKNILIFGCGGFVGPYLAKEFKAHNYKVYGSDILDKKLLPLHNFYEYFCADILDSESIIKLIERVKPEYIINLAAVSSVGASWKIPQKTVEININGTLNILESVRKLELETRILLIGSSEEYAISDSKISEDYPLNSSNPYGITKIAQENFADIYRKIYGLDIITTRTFNHTGTGQPENFVLPGFVKQAAEIHNSGLNGKIYVGNLQVKRDFGDVRDMVSAYRMILESNTRKTTFNVGSGICYCLEELLQFIISLTSRKIEIEISSEKLRPSDNPVIWCNNSLLRSETGWAPKYTVFDAVRGMFASMTGEKAPPPQIT